MKTSVRGALLSRVLAIVVSTWCALLCLCIGAALAFGVLGGPLWVRLIFLVAGLLGMLVSCALGVLCAHDALRSESGRSDEHHEAWDGERAAFLSIASHELRGPLTSITLHSQSLLRGCQDLACKTPDGRAELERCTRQAAAIERQAARMARLANELLDVGRVDQQRLEVVPRVTDLVSLAREAVEEVQGKASRHRLHLECEHRRLPLDIDAERIGQVLVNLLENAVKYSPEAHSVELVLDVQGGSVICAVKDQGIGIPPVEQDRLFARFFRASNARAAGISGFGLGLYICREIIERHGGRLWVSSEPGSGSTFYFTLPHPLRSVAPALRGAAVVQHG